MDDFEAIEDNITSFANHLAEDPEARFSVLRSCSFFKPIPNEWLMHISDIAKIRTFSSDVSITLEGDDMKAFYVILLGTAEAYRHDKLVGTIDTGECIGEGVFFASETMSSSASVIADYKIVAAEFDKDSIERLQADVETKAFLDKALLLALFKKLQGANRVIEEILSDDGRRAEPDEE